MEITVPEGFTEFAMQMMARAVKLREAGFMNLHTNPPPSVAYSAGGRAVWIMDSDMQELVEVAARALLLAVEPPTIEGAAK